MHTTHEHSKSTFHSRDMRLVAMLLTIAMCSVDLLFHSLNSLVCERLIFEHCHLVSKHASIQNPWLDLQKVSSSRVRLYVSGYMKYTNKNSKVIHPQ